MERDDVELIHSVLSGDENAFSVLVKKYQKGVHALAWRKIGDFHIAEEITQDAFLQAHRKLASLKNPDRFPGWLYVIADRLCRSWFRKKRSNIQSLETTREEILEKEAYANYVCEQREDAAVEHQRQIVQELMEKLPESERTVMVLYYLGEMNCAEISKFLGVSPHTVKSRLRRARERLKNEEHIIRETFGGIPLHPNLTESIMRNIDPVQQPSPSGSKPLPWVTLASSTVFAFLLMSASNQYLARSQQPYSLEVESEATVEIVDAPVVPDIQSKPELQNRVGNGTTPGRNSNNGLSKGTETVENNLTQDAMQWNLPEDAKARLGKGGIREIQYSPDGKLLAVASGIGIWLYDVTTHQEAALLTEHTSAVDSLAFSPDGRTFASGSRDGTIILSGPIIQLDKSTGEQKMLVGHTHWISSLAFSPDGKMLASDSRDGTIRFWDIHTGEHRLIFTGHTLDTIGVAFSPDGKTLASSIDDGTIRFWDTDTGNEKRPFTEHSESVYSVAFNPTGDIIASGSVTGIINLWHAGTAQHIKTLSGFGDIANNLVFSPDGRTLASGHAGIRLWDVETGEHKMQLTGHIDAIGSVAFSPDGKTLASGGWDKTIRLWDTHTGKHKKTLIGHTKMVNSIAFNPDGRTLASGSGDKTIRLWNVDTGKNEMTLVEHTAWIESIAFSPDGKTIASGGGGSIILLWNIDTRTTKMQLTGHTDWVESIAFSPDGKTIASGCVDATIHLWDTQTGAYQKTLRGHAARVESLAFSPDGKTLVSGSEDGSVLLWKMNP